MIKFLTTLIFVDREETTLKFRINAESPEEAALKAYEREDDLKPRNVQVGDGVIVLNQESPFTGYYIFDLPIQDGKPTLRQVIEPELDFWRKSMASNQERLKGVDVALRKAGIP
jgi:hypothetical protein